MKKRLLQTGTLLRKVRWRTHGQWKGILSKGARASCRLSACGDESALRGRIALPLGIEEVGKMPTLLEDTGGPPVSPF